jgi:hypothetical protein
VLVAKVMKLGSDPVAESFTTEILVMSPLF